MKKITFLIITLLIFNCSSDDGESPGSDPGETNGETTIICEKAVSIFSNFVEDSSISIFWSTDTSGETEPNSWVLEIGPEGFAPGSGTTFNTLSNGYNFENLIPQTSYDIYIKSKCDADIFGINVGPYNVTTESSCTTPLGLDSFSVTGCNFNIAWSGEGENAWEIEYGETGFTLGTGTVINTSNTQYNISENINPNTTYEVYIRANCGSDGYSAYADALVVSTAQGSINSGFLSGNYLLETLTDGALTAEGFGKIFGDSSTVFIQGQANNMREFQIGYYPDFLTNVPIMSFKFQLTNSTSVVVQQNLTNDVSCGATTIILGPSNETQTYNTCDDAIIEFSFFEFYQGSGDCGYTDEPVTIRLTKQ